MAATAASSLWFAVSSIRAWRLDGLEAIAQMQFAGDAGPKIDGDAVPGAVLVLHREGRRVLGAYDEFGSRQRYCIRWCGTGRHGGERHEQEREEAKDESAVHEGR